MTVFSDEIVIESVLRKKFLYTADEGKRIKGVFKKNGGILKNFDQNQLIAFFYNWGHLRGELDEKYSSNEDAALIYQFRKMDNNKRGIIKTIINEFYKASSEAEKTVPPIHLAVVNK